MGEIDAIIYEEWEHAFYDRPAHSDTVTFNAGQGPDSEMLRITPEGFYIRGVRVEADAKEAEQVYSAFKQWLTWNTLTGAY